MWHILYSIRPIMLPSCRFSVIIYCENVPFLRWNHDALLKERYFRKFTFKKVVTRCFFFLIALFYVMLCELF